MIQKTHQKISCEGVFFCLDESMRTEGPRSPAVFAAALTAGFDRTKRRALVIADNMCKLVSDVTEIQPFLPTWCPKSEAA